MPPTYKRKHKETQRLHAVDDPETGAQKLTPKQEAFVNNLLSGMSPKEAYRASFNVTSTSERNVSVAACKLRATPKIAGAIRLRQRMGLDQQQATRESHLAELARGREIAYELGQASAGIQAEHYRGRVAGLYNDKLTLAIGPTDEALLSQLAALLGPEAAKLIGEQMGVTEGETVNLEPRLDSELLSLPPPE